MQVVKVREKPRILEALKRKYDGSKVAGFDLVLDSIKDAKNVKEAIKTLMPLLRQRLLIVNPEFIQAVEIVEEHGEPAIKLYLLTKEITVNRYEVRVESLTIISWC